VERQQPLRTTMKIATHYHEDNNEPSWR